MLEKEGYTTLYEGGNGDFIDMKYGVDLIVEKYGDISLVQVKSKATTAKYSQVKNLIDILISSLVSHQMVMVL